jgi:DNA uptake protein ComE-like DNA-binding protein
MRLQHPIALSFLGAAISLACAQQSAPQHPHPAPSTQSSADPLDINTATPQQLNALPGFGPAYTRRVIAGRPYTAKNQLVTRGVIPQGAYENISALIVAHRVAR